MKSGEEFVLPIIDSPVTLHAGMSGSIYFVINGKLYGPAGTGTQVIKNVPLSQIELRKRYSLADVSQDPQLLRVAATVAVSSFTIGDLSD